MQTFPGFAVQSRLGALQHPCLVAACGCLLYSNLPWLQKCSELTFLRIGMVWQLEASTRRYLLYIFFFLKECWEYLPCSADIISWTLPEIDKAMFSCRAVLSKLLLMGCCFQHGNCLVSLHYFRDAHRKQWALLQPGSALWWAPIKGVQLIISMATV